MKKLVNLFFVYKNLSRVRRVQFILLIIFMMVGAFFEVVSISAVLPFLALISDNSAINNYPKLIEIFDLFGLNNQIDLVIYASILLVILSILAGVVRTLLAFCTLRFTFLIGAEIGANVYEKTLYQNYEYHILQNSSRIVANLNKVNSVVNGILQPFMLGLVAFIITVGILALLFIADAAITMGSLLFFATLYLLIIFLTRSSLRKNGEILANNETKRVQIIQESFGGIRDVILDNNYSVCIKKFNKINLELKLAEAFNNFISISPRFFVESMGLIMIVALSLIMVSQNNEVTNLIPILGLLGISVQKLLPLIQNIYSAWSSLVGSQQSLQDIVNSLKMKTSLKEVAQSKVSLQDKRYAQNFWDWKYINIKNISYAYCHSDTDVLNGVSIKIPRGSIIGIVGGTGSGKSTLIDLIMGFLEPTTGAIEVDDKKIESKNLKLWQSCIAHVPQSIYLNDASIIENIALGLDRSLIDLPLVHDVLKKACIYEFVMSLPDKLDTVVGEGGARLSGGQKQRIGIARALYKKASLLVLDEATSALDEVTESAVMSAFKNVNRELTVLIVAHRTTTLKNCDLIIQLSGGGILKTGSYNEFYL